MTKCSYNKYRYPRSEHISVGSIDFDDLNWDRTYSPTRAYARSKLANILFTKELATRTEGKPCPLRSVSLTN